MARSTRVVDGAHHRRTARQIAQRLDIVIGARGRRLVAVGSRFVVLAEALGQHRGDVLVGGDLDLDRLPQHDFGGAHRGDVGRIGEHQPRPPVRPGIRKHQRLTQESAREFRHQGRSGKHLRQACAGQPGRSPRPLVGEVIG